MFVCPLCEHQQAQGAVCEVCGKQLAATPAINVISEVLPDLETTVQPNGNPNVAVERMPDLDLHHAEPALVAAQPMPELERTALPDAGAAPVAPLLEAESTRYESDGQRTPLPTVLSCRYCGWQQKQGVLCERCGNKLPVSFKAASGAGAPEQTVTCRECGVKGMPGRRCLSCGTFLRAPSA